MGSPEILNLNKSKLETKSDREILQEVQVLRERVFAMYEVIRYRQERTEEYPTESVAEHIFSSIFLAEYFLKLEGLEDKIDYKKIIRMLLTHDLHEGITGDVLEYEQGSHLGTSEMPAVSLIQKDLPVDMGDLVGMYQEKESGSTLEGRFVQAIDKLQPLFWMFTDINIKSVKRINTLETIIVLQAKRNALLKDFPVMRKYSDVIYADMVNRGLLEF